MDEDMGGCEGVASSDDVNDISSAAQDALSTGIRYVNIIQYRMFKIHQNMQCKQ